MPWLSWTGLALLVGANSLPVVAGWVLRDRWAWPIDGGRVLRDGERLLGDHKTWRGFGAGVLGGAVVGAVLGLGAGHGALAGALAMVGDAVSSCTKRRLKTRPGTWVPLIDQLPEAALPLAALWRPLTLDWRSAAGTVLAFAVLDLVASRWIGSSAPWRAARRGGHAASETDPDPERTRRR